MEASLLPVRTHLKDRVEYVNTCSDCATRCWENTKYLSGCADKTTCLCHDVEYQNVRHTLTPFNRHYNTNCQICVRRLTYRIQSIFKCLYSQCDTAHFASALHYTITQCAGVAENLLFAEPPISNHDSLRRREAEYLHGVKLEDSESIAGYPTLSALPIQSGLPFASGVAISSNAPLQYLTRDPVTASAIASITASADSVQTTYNTPPEFITAGPLLYTGKASRILPNILLPLLATIWELYFAWVSDTIWREFLDFKGWCSCCILREWGGRIELDTYHIVNRYPVFRQVHIHVIGMIQWHKQSSLRQQDGVHK